MGTPGIRVPPPAYEPRLVARAILYACEHRKRSIVVGFGGQAIGLFGNLFPRATDLVMEAVGYTAQTSNKRPLPERADNLYEPRGDGTEKSLTRPVAPVRKTSLILEAQLNPGLTATVLAGIGALVLGAGAARRMGAGRAAYPAARTVLGPVARDMRRRVGRAF